MNRWVVSDGTCDAKSGMVIVADTPIGKANGGGSASLVFRATGLGQGADDCNGYYAGLSTEKSVVLQRVKGDLTFPKSAQVPITVNQVFHTKVQAIGDLINIMTHDSKFEVTLSGTSTSDAWSGEAVHDATFVDFVLDADIPLVNVSLPIARLVTGVGEGASLIRKRGKIFLNNDRARPAMHGVRAVKNLG
ncbi:hypothetical protein QQS21_003944 [Conoideocrella luteorostrata]|uniref:Uncharacterized protein n=1 Tax=Conoideocrella luteorostrata TaxID=1105319 RepID=A0AAJ0FV61_9HYPO|nr:hypothetical protein QQS21_003944 [Conoideocrella luteorostrata]